MPRSRTSSICRACASSRRLAESGFFGRVVGFRLEFGWWVFDGVEERCQRPSWNYRKAGGGGLILDMYPHFRYMIENILGPIERVACSRDDRRPGARRRARRALCGRRRGPHGDAGHAQVRRRRLHPRVLGDAGAARRPHDFSDRRHARLRRRRAAPLLRAVDRRHAEGRGVQPDDRSRHRLCEPLAGGAGGGALSQSLSGRMGGFPAPPRHRDAAALGFRRRHPRCRLCRGVLPQPRRRRVSSASTTCFRDDGRTDADPPPRRPLSSPAPRPASAG